jgi:uncharacterized membrane protein YukC
MADDLSIKDIITLFNNDLRSEVQLKEKLSSSEKQVLIDYIVEDLKEVDLEGEDGTGTESDLEY